MRESLDRRRQEPRPRDDRHGEQPEARRSKGDVDERRRLPAHLAPRSRRDASFRRARSVRDGGCVLARPPTEDGRGRRARVCGGEGGQRAHSGWLRASSREGRREERRIKVLFTTNLMDIVATLWTRTRKTKQNTVFFVVGCGRMVSITIRRRRRRCPTRRRRLRRREPRRLRQPRERSPSCA